MTNTGPERELLLHYKKILPGLHAFGEHVDATLMGLLKSDPYFNTESIEIPPSFRVKQEWSLIRKAYYRHKNYTDPLLEISDKVGTRIVLTTSKQVEVVERLIKSDTSWICLENKSRTAKSCLRKPKEFDYNSVHLILLPTKTVNFFRSFDEEQCKFYQCEVQLRTLLQQAYAQVAHDTIYKGPFSEDNELIRTLSTAQALMEVTDMYLTKALDTVENTERNRQAFFLKLIKIYNDVFPDMLNEQLIDYSLAGEFLDIYQVETLNPDDIDRIIQLNKDTIAKFFKKSDNYLAKQPIVLMVIYFILNGWRDRLLEDWPLDEYLLRDLCHQLGYSFGK